MCPAIDGTGLKSGQATIVTVPCSNDGMNPAGLSSRKPSSSASSIAAAERHRTDDRVMRSIDAG